MARLDAAAVAVPEEPGRDTDDEQREP